MIESGIRIEEPIMKTIAGRIVPLIQHQPPPRRWKAAFPMLSVLVVLSTFAAETPKTRNVVLITTDGLRWQEVFAGAEEMLITKDNGGVKDVDALRRDFWRPTPEERRKALMPFLWSEVPVKRL